MNFIFDALFNMPETRQKIQGGIDESSLVEIGVDVYYQKILLNLKFVENAIPNMTFKNHTSVQMQSGDNYVVKIKILDFFALIEHYDAGKYLCKLNN